MALSPEPHVEFDENRYPVVFSSDSTSDMKSSPPRWKSKQVPQTLSPKPWIVFQRVKVSTAQKGPNTSQLTQALKKQVGTTSSRKPAVPVTKRTGRRVTFAGANGNTKPPTPPSSKISAFEANKSVYFHTKDEILYSGKNRYEDGLLLVQTLLKQERLGFERLKRVAEEEEVRRRRRSIMTSSSTFTSSRIGVSDRSNTTTSSSTTISIDNPSWTCHNCGTTNSAFDTTCWHCKIHSRCVDCILGLSSTDGIDDGTSQLDYPSISTRFDVATLLNMPLTTPGDLTRRKRERAEYRGDTTRVHSLLKARVNQRPGLRSPTTVEVSRIHVISRLKLSNSG